MTAALPKLADPTQPLPRLRTVLLVDDNSIQRKLLATYLAAAGYLVETASAAEEGMERALREAPDLIISDVVMPDQDGFGLCRRVRAAPSLARVPVILISSHCDGESDRVLARHVGAFALESRTPDFALVLAAVARAFGEPRRGPRPTASPDAVERHLRAGADRLVRLAGKVEDAEKRYRALVEHTTDVVSVLDLEGTLLEANDRWQDVLGYSAAEMVGLHVRDFSVPGDEDSAEAQYLRSVDLGADRTPPVALRHRDGRVVYIEFSTTVIEVDGKTVVIAIGRDITERVAAMNRLAAEERKYRTLVDNIPDVVWSATADGRLTFLSANVARVLGYPAASVIDQQWNDITMVHPEDQARLTEAYSQFLGGNAGFDIEYRRRHGDGRWIWIHNRATHRGVENGVVRIDGLCTDVTERKSLEDQIRQAQKMEAIGQLSGGIAHDFNNILAVVLANSEFLIDALADHDPRQSDALEIKHAGERGAALTRQLLAFSRRQVLQPATLDLDPVVHGLEKMLCRLLGEDIELVVRTGGHHGMTHVDPGQLEQVIMNLVVNARDAMPGGGTLTVETANVELDDLAATQIAGLPGPYVTLTVTDTGCGMDAAIRARIFEPFYTTKEKGRGTGLGLSTCHGIIKQSGGYVTVYSEVGLGTVFTVYLPRVDAIATSEQLPARRQAVGGTETVLLVEDDEVVRTCVSRMLEDCGYHVLAARDGEDAVAIARRRHEQIDLVLSDVIMPRSSGPDIVTRIHELAPQARALFMSGYSDHAILRNGALRDGLAFLPKPFDRNALARKVREVLDASLAEPTVGRD